MIGSNTNPSNPSHTAGEGKGIQAEILRIKAISPIFWLFVGLTPCECRERKQKKRPIWVLWVHEGQGVST